MIWSMVGESFDAVNELSAVGFGDEGPRPYGQRAEPREELILSDETYRCCARRLAASMAAEWQKNTRATLGEHGLKVMSGSMVALIDAAPSRCAHGWHCIERPASRGGCARAS